MQAIKTIHQSRQNCFFEAMNHEELSFNSPKSRFIRTSIFGRQLKRHEQLFGKEEEEEKDVSSQTSLRVHKILTHHVLLNHYNNSLFLSIRATRVSTVNHAQKNVQVLLFLTHRSVCFELEICQSYMLLFKLNLEKFKNFKNILVKIYRDC